VITKQVVSYNYIEAHDINEFIFTKSSRLGMDEYIGFIYEFYEERIKGKSEVLIILDIHQSGMLPIKYASLIMEKTFKELSPFPKPFVAYLTDETSDRSLINIMDYTASRQVDRLHFPLDDREKAIEWLLTKRAINI